MFDGSSIAGFEGIQESDIGVNAWMADTCSCVLSFRRSEYVRLYYSL